MWIVSWVEVNNKSLNYEHTLWELNANDYSLNSNLLSSSKLITKWVEKISWGSYDFKIHDLNLIETNHLTT